MKEYIAKHIPSNQLNVTGKADDRLWKIANVLTDFSSPWSALHGTKTEFRALWDDKNLYFMFQVFDTSIHIDKKSTGNESINVSDRVELFFRQDDSLTPYYCLEIDPSPRIMDFKAFPNRVFDFEWNWPEEHLTVKSHSDVSGFIVEGKISIFSMEKLNLIHNNRIETGIFRAKYIKVGGSSYDPIWITWTDPKTRTPDFHVTSSFGVLMLEKAKSSVTDR
ncbi:Carbohydrate family 9 binding domain-like [Flagellimonas taeanensis]|uniref:Carbohydrate family 9 binding domain-like n=1 Tax=Flagellimonas taeanensis TaxID=1005926 RepID=A0A1M6Z7Y5_9FLAO|nr:sugar-binding protein [Allomuricauda taeanensis]SFC11039.1 Carbohydrate family 9 binding domain-like [Allomuricauda taeanensis]SHL26584.1 Carbohydrate family 9 binding domain-like [Allomuricauda taeanensis]